MAQENILEQIMRPEEDEVEAKPDLPAFDSTSMLDDILFNQEQVPRETPVPLDEVPNRILRDSTPQEPDETGDWLDSLKAGFEEIGQGDTAFDQLMYAPKLGMDLYNYGQRVVEDPQELIHDLTDTSLEPYISDEDRANLPADDPRKDAVGSVMVGDWLAGIATKLMPAYGKQVLKNAPAIADTLTSKVTGDLAGMKPTLGMTDETITAGVKNDQPTRQATERSGELQAEAQSNVGRFGQSSGTGGGLQARKTEEWADVPSGQIEQSTLIDDADNMPLKVAQDYQQSVGIPPSKFDDVVESSLEQQGAIAEAFNLAPRLADNSAGALKTKDAIYQTYVDDMPEIIEQTGAKNYNELVESSYAQVAKETDAMYNALPVNVTFDKDGSMAYPNSATLRYDINNNNHMSVYQGGDPHELLGKAGKNGISANDKFRAVHDYFAHGIRNHQFGRKGEQNGTEVHAQMYSPLARLAMVAETRGQNSVVNYSNLNYGIRQEQKQLREAISDAKRTDPEAVAGLEKQLAGTYGNMKYADQKAILLPSQMNKIDFDGVMPEGVRSVMSPKGDKTTGRHFSNQKDIDTLDPSYAGTASAGKEKGRTEKLAPPLKGIQFYMEGANPEGMVVSKANSMNEAQLDNLYPMKEDPMNLAGLAREQGYKTKDDLQNAFVRNVHNAGYTGFHDGNIAVVTGEQPVDKLLDLSDTAGRKSMDAVKAFDAPPLAGITETAKAKPKRKSKKIKGSTTVKHGSRAEAEAQGYWHPIGEGKKLKKPVPEFKSEKTELDIEPRKIITPEDILGESIIPASGDRTSAGKILTSVGGHEFRDPIRLEGGMDYMRDNPEAIWASDKGVVTKLMNSARPAQEAGDTVNMIYLPMNHKATNFSTMMTDAIFEQIVSGDVSKTAMNMFDRKLRKLRPEWKGLMDENAMQQLNGNGDLRHAFADTAKLEEFQRRGFPDLAETRYAITEDLLLDVPLHYGGQSIGRMSGSLVDDPVQPHSTYNTAIGGDYVGGFADAVPRDILFPEFTKQRRAEGALESADYRSFSLKNVIQKADDEWLDGIMNYLESAKEK